MTLYKCDRCGETNSNFNNLKQVKVPRTFDIEFSKELCAGCRDKLIQFMTYSNLQSVDAGYLKELRDSKAELESLRAAEPAEEERPF